MGSNANVVFTPGTLPAGFCHQNWQMTFDAFVELLHGYLPGEYSTFNYGASTPAVEDQDKPWLKTYADGSPAGWKIFFGGEWVNAQRHPLFPGHVSHYYGDVSDIPFLDDPDGDGTNPFWLLCDGTNSTPDLRSRVIVGAGQGAGLSLYANGATGGEETHVLTADEAKVQEHKHRIGVETDGYTVAARAGRLSAGSGVSVHFDIATTTTQEGETDGVKDLVAGDNDAHENRPPYLALWPIMRSNRLY